MDGHGRNGTDSPSGGPASDVGAVVVAAGVGRRFGDRDKAMADLCGRPMLLWAVEAVAAVAARVVVVTRPEAVAGLAAAVGTRLPPDRFLVVPGGMLRQDSVRLGLDALAGRPADLVAVQDAARPLTSVGLVDATVRSARRRGSGVAARRAADTVKEADTDGRVLRTLDRSRLWQVETPQTFACGLLSEALRRLDADGVEVTDDAAAVERAGDPVWLVDSAPWGPNDKVTVAGDVERIESVLRARLAAGRG